MFVFEARGSTIVFKIACAQKNKKVFILPANICPIVPLTLEKAKTDYEFVDIDSESLHLDPKQLYEKLKNNKERYSAVIFVRPYGHFEDKETFFNDLKELNKDLLIIDDRCLCYPLFNDHTPSIADVVLYSTGNAKAVDLGYGGFALLKPDIPYGKVNLPYEPIEHERLVENYKQAILAKKSFSYIDTNWLDCRRPNIDINTYFQKISTTYPKIKAHREQINKIYSTNIPEELQLPSSYQNWRFNIRLSHKTRILKIIFDNGFFASSHYASLPGIFKEGNALVAEANQSCIVNLFNDYNVNSTMAEKLSILISSLIS